MEYFKLNQTVYHPIYGEGKVITIIENVDYSIRVNFKQGNTCFTKDGRCVIGEPISLSQNPIPEIVNKPLEPVYEPFTYEDYNLLMGKWIRHKNHKSFLCIIRIFENKLGTYELLMTYEDLLKDYEFSNGEPCGKKVE